MKNFLVGKLSIILFLGILPLILKAQNQSDSSDAVWSIVAPIHSSNDIDMKKCMIGSKKDSVIEKFISNVGSYKFRVDSVFVTGSDASSFKLVSGIPPYSISTGSSKTVEFRFIPKRIGLHQAIVNIITQFDTLQINIYGEGIEQSLEIESDIIDFGLVEIGSSKDTTVVLLKNLLSKPVTIENSILLGPDKKQFEILAGGGSFTLNGKESKELHLRFKPEYIGRTSGQIGFIVSGMVYPVKAQLFGQGIGVKVYCTSDSCYPGEKRDIFLKFSAENGSGLNEIIKGFKAKLRFLNTIITPIQFNLESQNENFATINLEGNLTDSNILSKIEFLAGLGNTDLTSIDIIEFNWIDSSGKEINYESETQSGIFKILGICKEGGNRFVNSTGIANISKINPNPASDKLEIELELCENERTKLEIIDLTGRNVKTILNENISSYGKQLFTINLCEMDSGIYFIRLQTPTLIEYKKIHIVK